MTVAELLSIDPWNKKTIWRKNLRAVIKEVNFKNDNKLVELTLADVTGQIKLVLWKFKYQTEEKNPYWRMYDEGQEVQVTNAVVKAGYNGGPNELAMMKAGDVKVLGTAEIPDTEEQVESLDELISRNSGTNKKKTYHPEIKPYQPGNNRTKPTPTTVVQDNTALIKKLDEVIDAINNIPLAIGNLDKNLQRKLDENNTKLMQQFKEFMSKFIESSEVTPEDLNLGDERSEDGDG